MPCIFACKGKLNFLIDQLLSTILLILGEASCLFKKSIHGMSYVTVLSEKKRIILDFDFHSVVSQFNPFRKPPVDVFMKTQLMADMC